MSWDHPVHSFNYPNGEPQTPTRTPNTFDSFHTPKLESSFFDPRVTWDTSDPYASSPELLRTPQKFGLGSSNSQKGHNGETTGYKGRSSDQTDTARRIRSVKPHSNTGEDYPRTVGSAKSAASMQTPPPTSASRRKIPEFDQPDGHTQGGTPGVGGHLETPSRLLGASPRMFGNLQSSPDLFQLASLDPTSSPFFPQQRLFWDHDLDNTASEIPLPSNGNNSNARETSAFTNTHHIPQLPTVGGSVDLPDFGNGFGISAPPPTDAALFPAPFSTSPRLPVTKAEDPALFLSSPARRFGGPQLTPETRSLHGLRQPYHHQAEESRREELIRAQAPNGHRSDPFTAFPSESEEEDDDYTPRGIRPGLTRSVTHHGLSSSSRPVSQAGLMASTSGVRKSPCKGRSSPAKPMRPAPLTRSSSMATGTLARSSSVVLRIGRDGRAKAEMEPLSEAPTGLTDPLTGIDLDGSTTESESDPAEFSEYPVLHRAQSSLSLYDSSRRPLSRSDSGSRPPSKGSYASTVGSSHSGRMSPWAGSSRGGGRATYRGSPDIKRTPKRHSSLLHSDSTYTRSSVASDLLPGEDEESGDAQSALRQVLKERGRGPRPATNAFGNRLSRSSHTLAHLRSSPPRLGSDFDIHPRHNASPTTMTDPDLATPSTERHSNPSNGTRCVCRSMDNGGHLMIQCESCTHWLHTRCVGLERANLPSVYVCVFCAQTPSRQNRARTTYVPTGQAPPSPLAHKSFRFR